MRSLWLLPFALLVFSSSSEAAVITAFYVESSPTTYITWGLNTTYTGGEASPDPAHGDYIFFFAPVYRILGAGSSIYLDVGETPDFLSEIYIANPDGSDLSLGSYGGSTNPRGGQIYFDWTADGRGVNTDSYVEILDLTYDQNHQIASFAADFYFFETESVREYGSYRYNSTIPLNVPEPSATLLSGAVIFCFNRRKRRSVH
jgi:hypothetical protein